MSYVINPEDGDIIIGGFDKGIGASPYVGLTDVKNVNVTTIPGEASVAFKTSSVSQAPVYTNIIINQTGISNVYSTTQATLGLEDNQAISISASTITGLNTGSTPLYITSSSAGGGTTTFSLTQTYGGGAGFITGTSGQATLSVVPMIFGPRGALTKNYFAESRAQSGGTSATILAHWVADSNGRVWSDTVTTQGGGATATNSWTYTGNTIDATDSRGNGLVYFGSQGTNGVDGWLFLFRRAQIDYLKVIADGTAIAPSVLSWVYGWKPSTGTINESGYLTKTNVYGSTAPFSHEAIITPGGFGGFVNYCDSYNIGQFSQASRATPFNPQGLTTYNFATFGILPTTDVAQCLSYFGANMLIGGIQNLVYPWDLVSSNPQSPLIVLPENNTTSIVTGANSAYIFAGNTGRIYITNGSNANLWKKVPDHISGAVQPILAWGGTTYGRNKLLFGLFTSQGGAAPLIAANSNYGGVWAVDLESNAMYVSNILSDGVYTGYPSGIFPFTTGDTLAGYGFYAASTPDSSVLSPGSVNVTVNTPYSGTQAVIVSDLIPIGTAFQPTTPAQFEYKLSMPLLVNESLELQIGSSLADYVNNTFTSLGTTTGSGTATTGTIISDLFPNVRQNMQWLLVKAILTSTATSPSYVRLTGIRVKGATVAQTAMSNFLQQ